MAEPSSEEPTVEPSEAPRSGKEGPANSMMGPARIGAMVLLLLIALPLAYAGLDWVWRRLGPLLAPSPSLLEIETRVRDSTAVVSAVRDLARLETVSFHMERVIEVTSEQSQLFGFIRSEDALLLVAAADVVAGVNLARLAEQDVLVDLETRSATVVLPAPEVLTTAIDNERTYVHERRTDMLARRQESLEGQARARAERELREAAIEAGILDRASQNAERTVTTLLQSLGFERVRVTSHAPMPQ